jgi:hypothetical protein
MALSSFRDTTFVTKNPTSIKLTSGVTAYAGGIVCIDTATGYGVVGQVKTGLVCRGIARETVENPVGGTLSVPVDEGPAWVDIYSSDSVTQANVGQPVYIYDDYRIAATDGNSQRSVAGVLLAYDAAKGALVHFGSVDGTALAAEIATREAATSALAGNLTGQHAKVNTTSNTIGSLVIQHRIAVPSSATGTVSVTLNATYGAMLITDVHFIKAGSTGGSSDTVQVTDGTYAISDAMSLNSKAAGAIVRAATLNPTYTSLAAGATLVASYTRGTTSCEGTLFVTGLRVS